MNTKFKFSYLENQLIEILKLEYIFYTCFSFISTQPETKAIIIRVDIDLSCKNAYKICNIFNRLGIRGTFFIRLHANEYNPFSLENYSILKYIRDSGHEIGYHSEIMDQSNIWGEPPIECLKKDIDVLNKMLHIDITGIASHNGLTGVNNLDFWRENHPSDFGLLYEAYDEILFKNIFYISDSGGLHWKCYNKGVLMEGDYRCPADHVKDNHDIIQLLVHPIHYED